MPLMDSQIRHRVYGVGLRVQGSGFGVWDLGLWVYRETETGRREGWGKREP